MKTLIAVLLLASSFAFADKSAIVGGNLVTQSQWIKSRPRVAHDFNKSLPSVMDSTTVLESVHADGIIFNYNYTLDLDKLSVIVYGAVQYINAAKMQEVRQKQRAILIANYCGSERLENWRNLGTMILHNYFSSEGNTTISILVNPTLDCKKIKGNV